MSAELALRHGDLADVPADLVDATRELLANAKAPSTRRAYLTSWRLFDAWCRQHNLPAMPAAPMTLALYVTDLARCGRKVATIMRAVSAISQAHEMAGHASPRGAAVVREALKGIRRTRGTAPSQKKPLLSETLVSAVAHLPGDLRGCLHRAILLVGFAGAFRRSELVAIDVEDLEFTDEGVKVLLRRSKTDQEGAGRKVALLRGASGRTCPAQALQAWMAAAGIRSGPVFRAVNRWGRVADARLCDATVAAIVKEAVRAAGLDAQAFAAHSMRAGFVTSAARAGKTEFAIMRVTGHRSVDMVHRYVREANLFRDHAAEGIGL
ncbi:MAG: site-specific integrase [Polyangiales bacterium]